MVDGAIELYYELKIKTITYSRHKSQYLLLYRQSRQKFMAIRILECIREDMISQRHL